MFNAPDGVAIRKHLNRLEKRANRDLSHEDPQREIQRPILGQDKVHLPAQAEDVAAESCLVERDLEPWWKTSWLYRKANSIMSAALGGVLPAGQRRCHFLFTKVFNYLLWREKKVELDYSQWCPVKG